MLKLNKQEKDFHDRMGGLYSKKEVIYTTLLIKHRVVSSRKEQDKILNYKVVKHVQDEHEALDVGYELRKEHSFVRYYSITNDGMGKTHYVVAK